MRGQVMLNLILVVCLSLQPKILSQLYRLWVMALMIIYTIHKLVYIVECMHAICRSALPQKFLVTINRVTYLVIPTLLLHSLFIRNENTLI
jgi:hypothetical protein